MPTKPEIPAFPECPFGIVPIVTYNYMMDGTVEIIDHLKDMDSKTEAKLIAWKRAAEREI